jgi:antitoxin (DNA-binding transcriptional repressor) of toxin-antitoxin stability system/predicted nucleic acid-binding protein
MKRATISQAKDPLSELLASVKRGETVLILDGDRPIARLAPVDAAERDADERLTVERRGVVHRASKPPLKKLPPPTELPEGVVREPVSPALAGLHRHDPQIVVAWTATIECASAFVRKHRERVVSDAQLARVLRRIAELAARWNVSEPNAQLHVAVERLVVRQALKAGDAIQLASAAALGTGGEFVCLGRRLALAATNEGLRVVPEKEG